MSVFKVWMATKSLLRAVWFRGIFMNKINWLANEENILFLVTRSSLKPHLQLNLVQLTYVSYVTIMSFIGDRERK